MTGLTKTKEITLTRNINKNLRQQQTANQNRLCLKFSFKAKTFGKLKLNHLQ
jgi:hypothetical protein